MRKITMAISLSILALCSNAQITKGSLFFGGSVNVNSSKTTQQNFQFIEQKNSSWSLTPQIGTAIGENKIAGIFLSFINSRQTQTDFSNNKYENNSSTYGGGFFYRRYYALSQRFYLYGEGTIGYSNGTSEQKNRGAASSSGKTNSVSAFVTPGLSFAAGRKIHLEASLNNLLGIYYQSNKVKLYSTPGGSFTTADDHSFTASVNSNGFSGISIGLRWIIPSLSK